MYEEQPANRNSVDGQEASSEGHHATWTSGHMRTRVIQNWEPFESLDRSDIDDN